MDIPETVSVRKFREFSARQKHELYETLLELAETLEELPKKSLRKTLELTLAVLQYNGEQAQRLQDESEKLKRMIQKLEDDRDGVKLKNKELSEELKQQQLQLRLATQEAEGSDKDSSDPLSELDKQEQLLHNIDAKNKHIKRLLREIESLQNQNITQSKTIVLHEQELQQIKANLLQLSQDITKVEKERQLLQQREQQQSLEIARLEGNITFLEDERDKQEQEMREFLQKYESQALSWKLQLEQKDKELSRLSKQPEHKQSTVLSSSSSGRNLQDEEHTKLRHLLELREKRIEALEARLKTMADEMINSTKVMNRLRTQREHTQDPQKPSACCQLIEERLRVAQERAQQLADLLDSTEQDNVIKSKQALHALNALESYKRGEDGLVPALRRCSTLEQKLAERDKQLRCYVQELNAMHELGQENEVLRRRLNIPDDAVVLSKQVRAKQRNKEKQIERLTLKLRTSEELRLQLKLDKSELRRNLLELQGAQASLAHNQLETSLQQPSEVGEVPASAPIEDSPRRGQGDGAATSELQTKYEDLLAENETLRIGMYEILEKLREYDATSELINIDSELLRRLLEVLPNQQATPQRLHGELLELKAREQALRQLLQQNGSESETGELSSVHSMRDVSDLQEEVIAVDTATRPTTPTVEQPLPVIEETSRPGSAELLELQSLRKHYEELRVHMSADGNELIRYNQQLHEQVLSLERELKAERSSYAHMRQDYDVALTQLKQQELRFIEQTASWGREQAQQKAALAAQSTQLEQLQAAQVFTTEQTEELQQRNALLSQHLASALAQLLGELKLPDLSADYGIIDENYQLDYVPAAEFAQQRLELANWRSQQAELQRENKQLAQLLQVANQQISSQQQLLNELTDNHINLRHMVADLQSDGDDKLLLAKMQRDLDQAKSECLQLEQRRKQSQLQVDSLETQLHKAILEAEQHTQRHQQQCSNYETKLNFLQRALLQLKEKYAKFTPLIFLSNFAYSYQRNQQPSLEFGNRSELIAELLQSVQQQLNTLEPPAEQLVKLIKAETQSKLLEHYCEQLDGKQAALLKELHELRLQQATDATHWQTIEALFGEPKKQPKTVATQHVETNTEAIAAPVAAKRRSTQLVDKQCSPIGSPSKRSAKLQSSATQTEKISLQLLETGVQTNGMKHHQEVQTEQDAKLEQLKATLQAANLRIEQLQSTASQSSSESDSQHSGVVEKTILSFHSLLLEKDQSIQKYQDLLQSEREQSQQLISKQLSENESLKATVNNLNFNIKTKDSELLHLKRKLEQQTLAPAVVTGLPEITDEHIEELFECTSQEEPTPAHSLEDTGEQEKQDTEELKELPTLHKQIKELKDKLSFHEQNLLTREEEIELLKEKLKLCQEREEREKSMEQANQPEVEQLRVFLEEKDKHIRDLMDTLKNFHDDQQRYINDTSNYSADQIAKLAADLNRSEATTKIYHTQMEALRRQLTNLTQREKQARELSQSLRQQLLKRPVVSIKTELNARVKHEQQQKRIQQLELELDESRAQLQRQQTLLDAKRTRSANEVGLWEKQKRWQQQADKFKAKLDETELALEKTRTLLQAARTTIVRLEKDKQLLESKVGRGVGVASNSVSQGSLKCCRAPSCPNLQHVGGSKFTPSPSESPETYTGASSECSSPAHRQSQPSNYYEQGQTELLEALKARIELQQRKIMAMELEGRGSNALTTELEKLQERLQSLEAQNIRLEARNLQLQLDTDLLRQGDSSERLQKRIKHLEDYILALKEEMARNDSRRELCKCSGLKLNTQQGQSAEHTILSLRNLVEKLRTENKFLKDGRRSTDSRSSTDSAPPITELSRLQLSKQRSSGSKDDELKYIKDQLVKKTQLLQKAKVLLTRAAAKEKVLREQIAVWKRKCSELQNVPVIDEISE
ncbi:centrosomal protein cep290 [Drosophila busckii]|uniref:centrosomal protein cep290 n=1 Tax=Drosophila busckii TaxID=30019 RepID=UPI001433428C|nr:centrosomal protein cep290 [Drosophila busckii]